MACERSDLGRRKRKKKKREENVCDVETNGVSEKKRGYRVCLVTKTNVKRIGSFNFQSLNEFSQMLGKMFVKVTIRKIAK